MRVVAGAIVRDGRVLAARRGAGGREPLLWELPGGKVEGGETDAQALVRELREELRVDVDVQLELGTSTWSYAHGEITLVAWRCSLRSGEPVAVEHAELRWLSRHELDSVEWAPADLPLLEAVARCL